MDDDRALVTAVLGGEPGAFERLVREYQGLCWHIVQRMVRHPEDARDLCQDAFLRVPQCLHQYRFAGTEPDDAENLTNRAPYPILHLLREDSVDRAVAAYPEPDAIIERNVATMRTLGVAGFRRLLEGE